MNKKNWRVSFVDIEPALREGRLPEDYVSVGADMGRCLVLAEPVEAQEKCKWFDIRSGEAVRVPLHPYVTSSQDPEMAIAMAFQIGMIAAGDIDYSVKEYYLSVGSPVEELSQYKVDDKQKATDCFRFWLGLAVKVYKS